MCEKDWFAQDVHKIWDFFSVIRPTKRKACVSRHKWNRFRHQPSEQSASFIIDKKSIIWKKHLNKQVINFTIFFFEYKKKHQNKQRNQIFLILSFIIRKKTHKTIIYFHHISSSITKTKHYKQKQSHSSFYLPSSRKKKRGAEQGTRKRKASHSHQRHTGTQQR